MVTVGSRAFSQDVNSFFIAGGLNVKGMGVIANPTYHGGWAGPSAALKAESSVGFNIGCGLFVNKHVSAIVEIASHGFILRDSNYPDFRMKLKGYEIMAALKYSITASRLIPYGQIGVASYSAKLSSTLESSLIETIKKNYGSDTQFGIVPALGLEYKFSSSVALGAGLEYNYLFGGPIFSENDQGFGYTEYRLSSTYWTYDFHVRVSI